MATYIRNTGSDLVDDLSQIKTDIATIESREELLERILIAEATRLDAKLDKKGRAKRKHFRFPKAPKVRRRCVRV